MIIDASVVIDAVADAGPRGAVARDALAGLSATEPLIAPGHFAVEILSGLNAIARRPGTGFAQDRLAEALVAALTDAADLGISIEPTPWEDVHRAWELAQQSLTYADAIYVAAAERMQTALMTSDARIERSGADYRCAVIVIGEA